MGRLDVTHELALRAFVARDVDDSPDSARLRRQVADLVLETTPEGIWLIDAQARTTFVNRRIAELLGYTEEEMLGRPVFDFIDRKRWPVAEKNLTDRARGLEERQEVELLRKDGTRVWVLGSANPVFDRDGNYAGALAVLGDLSPQKERERYLRGQIEDLRARLAARIARHGSEHVARPEPDLPPYPEPFRTAIVLGLLGSFAGMTAMLTIGAVVSALLGGGPPTEGGV